MNIGWKWFRKNSLKKLLVLFFLATISTVSFVILVKNGAEKVYSLLKPTSGKTQPKYILYSFGQKPLIVMGAKN